MLRGVPNRSVSGGGTGNAIFGVRVGFIGEMVRRTVLALAFGCLVTITLAGLSAASVEPSAFGCGSWSWFPNRTHPSRGDRSVFRSNGVCCLRFTATWDPDPPEAFRGVCAVGFRPRLPEWADGALLEPGRGDVLQVDAYGWPWVCLRSAAYEPDPQRRAPPAFLPILPGLIADTAAYAALLWAVTLVQWPWKGGLVHHWRRRRVRAGLCWRCAYNMRGVVSGRCPECGAWASSRQAAKKLRFLPPCQPSLRERIETRGPRRGRR